MLNLSTRPGPFRVAVMSGLALLAVFIAVAMLVRTSPPPPAAPPPPAERPGTPQEPAVAPALLAPTPDPNLWPTDREDQIRATQRLLGELKLMNEAPTGEPGPVTQAAIRDYQRMAGLNETGEVSEALFVSLKEVAAMVFPKSTARSD